MADSVHVQSKICSKINQNDLAEKVSHPKRVFDTT